MSECDHVETHLAVSVQIDPFARFISRLIDLFPDDADDDAYLPIGDGAARLQLGVLRSLLVAVDPDVTPHGLIGFLKRIDAQGARLMTTFADLQEKVLKLTQLQNAVAEKLVKIAKETAQLVAQGGGATQEQLQSIADGLDNLAMTAQATLESAQGIDDQVPDEPTER